MKVTIEETQTLVYSLYVLHYFINLVSNWAWSKCGNVCEAIPPMLLAVNQPWLIPPYNQGGGNRALCILPQTKKQRVHTWDDDGPSSNQSCSTSSGGVDLTAIKPGDSCNWRRRMNFFTSSPPPAFMCLACIALHCTSTRLQSACIAYNCAPPVQPTTQKYQLFLIASCTTKKHQLCWSTG